MDLRESAGSSGPSAGSGEEFGELLAAASRGEPDACATLWRRYAGKVAGYARAHGSQEPDDLTSEVFLAVFRQLGGFAGDEAAFRGWLFTIAHHRVVDELRVRSRRPALAAWSAETDERRSDSAEEEMLRSSRDVVALLERLSPEQREVLTLRVLGDLTVDQVAAVVGKQPGAVKALQRRGLEALRRMVAAGSVQLAAGDGERVRTSGGEVRR